MNEENKPIEEPSEFTPMADGKIQEALEVIRGRSFSARHPELGKMVNCQVCGHRHRANERKCEQKFTNVAGEFEYFREDENGSLVPDLRTAVRPNEAPTRKQILGQAAFAKKRFHPHPSKIKLLLIERTRVVFEALGFELEKTENQTPEEFSAEFQKNLQRARIVAARQIRKEREFGDREIRRRQDQSRRINRGLI